MPLSEADIRAKLIDPAIHKRGWTEDLIRREETAGSIEIIGGKARRRSTIQGLTRDFVSKLPIPLPSVKEQKRIVAILNEQMAAVERVRKAAEEELATINALPSALLRKAFSGEL